MSVLVDTSVWSLALRRKPKDLNKEQQHLISTLAKLVQDGQVIILGCIRQELLTGIKEQASFEKLRQKLAAFPDEPVVTPDYEEAAKCFNLCRSGGITGSAIDLLICAVSLRLQLDIFTTDPDFVNYSKQLPLKIYKH